MDEKPGQLYCASGALSGATAAGRYNSRLVETALQALGSLKLLWSGNPTATCADSPGANVILLGIYNELAAAPAPSCALPASVKNAVGYPLSAQLPLPWFVATACVYCVPAVPSLVPIESRTLAIVHIGVGPP